MSTLEMPTREKVCIIGGGFSGLGLGTQLKFQRIPFDILEKDRFHGGNWYHGV
jgi:cation diffusion facilitator CzcD-associated flavoprotein CzcO